MNSKIELYIIDEINAKLVGLPKKDKDKVVQKMKLPIPGSYMMASVQIGEHDGKQAMFTEDGFFDVHQLDDVFSILEGLGYDVEGDMEVHDFREELLHPVNPENQIKVHKDMFSDCGIELWEHQISAFDSILSNDKGIWDFATSAGKTLMASGTSKIYDPYYPSLFLTLNTKLAKDAAKMYEKMGLDYKIIDASIPVKKRKEAIENHRHLIMTRKIAINCAEHLDSFNGVMIVDELHVAGEAFVDFVRNRLGDCPIRVGMSGSLPEKGRDPLKLQTIKNIIGNGVCDEVTPGYLIEQGHAAYLDIRLVEVEDKNGLRKQQEAGGEWDWDMEFSHYNNDEDRIAEIAKFIDENCPRNTFIICSPVLGYKLSQKLDCDFIDGDVSDDVRQQYYDNFDVMDDYRLVGSDGTSGVGLSIDMIHYGVVIDIGSNPSRAGQAVGRFLRKDNEGDQKDSAIVWDIYSNTKYGYKQMKERCTYYRKRGFDFTKKYATIEVV